MKQSLLSIYMYKVHVCIVCIICIIMYVSKEISFFHNYSISCLTIVTK